MTIIKRLWTSLERRRQRRQPLTEFERLGKLIDRKRSPIEGMFWDKAYPILRPAGLFTPQVAVEGYKVDFVFLPSVGRKKVVIELYGYDYHNGKQQMLYDTRRIRELQELGYETITFMGADIYGDAAGCAEQVLRIARTQ